MAEAFVGKIESAVDAPELAALPGLLTRLGHARAVDDANAAAVAGQRHVTGERLADQQAEPVAAARRRCSSATFDRSARPTALAQAAVERRPVLAQAVGQDDAQQIDGRGDRAWAKEGLRVARALAQFIGTAELLDDAAPISVQQ